MIAKDIMTSNPQTCHPNHKVCEAVNIMKKYDCGVVPVTDGSEGQKLVGIITDRDIALTMCEQEKACRDIDIQACMSQPVYSVHPDDNIEKVEEMMKQHQIHRVPVVDQNGMLLGIIALADIAREIDKEKMEGRHELEEEDLAEVVEEIRMPYHRA